MAPNPKSRLVFTGIGVAAPNGIGAEEWAGALIAGKSGLARPRDVDLAGLKTSSVGQIHNFDITPFLDPAEARRIPRTVHLALAASHEALTQSGLVPDPADLDLQRQIGVALGTGGGGLAFVEDQYRQLFAGGKPSLYSITGGTHGNLSSELSIALHLRGPSHVLSTGCTSSTDALGYAALLIRNGTVPAMLVGGSDAPIAQGILHAFEKMRVVSTKTWDDPAQSSRPFDRDRDGFVLGEGAWMFVLEDHDHAIKRGAPILAEFLGYGSTCDAYHRVQIAPDVAEPTRAIELALKDAALSAGQIDYVNLHGTSTEMNDRMETLAMHRALGDHAKKIPMSSTKSMIGHPQGACGAAGIAATILCLNRGMIHPSINLAERDEHCDLNYVPRVAVSSDATIALCNCIAFGSKNSAIIIRCAPDRLDARS